MFDVGFWELAAIGVIALVIIGPERLPGAARTVGMWVGRARRVLRDVKDDIDRELKAHEIEELHDLQKDVRNAGDAIKDSVEDAAKKDKNVADGIFYFKHRGNTAKIHRGDCLYCNNGRGQQKDNKKKSGGKQSADWYGPFTRHDLAMKIINIGIQKQSECGTCMRMK